MFGIKTPVRRSSKDEAEKPFWISFSDLMTALMVLFLVAMTVALLAITNEISESQRLKTQREEEIQKLMERMKQATQNFPGIIVNGHSVDFGDLARFDSNSHKLTPVQARLLRTFLPKVLEMSRDPLGQKWFKRVIVEGFADKRGTYLHNLNLSMQRSERVLCALLAKPERDELPLSSDDRLLVRELFLVGGSSFNSMKSSLEESRRIELKLEFLDVGEPRQKSPKMPLDEDKYCPLD
ncbi:MAG: flagellar motor protein MotB [Chlorobium sp.]